MPDTDTLRGDLTRALQEHLPPHLVAPAVEAGLAAWRGPQSSDADWLVESAAHTIARALPPPYDALAATLAGIVGPPLRAWLADRPIVAPGVVVTDTRD